MSKESAYFTLGNLGGKRDAHEIKRLLDTIPGVISVSVNTITGNVAVDFDNTGTDHGALENKLGKAGFTIIEDSGKEHIM